MSCRHYICEGCSGQFHTEKPQSETQKEYENAPYYAGDVEKSVVCDDCYNNFMEWYNGLSPEQHQQILSQRGK